MSLVIRQGRLAELAEVYRERSAEVQPVSLGYAALALLSAANHCSEALVAGQRLAGLLGGSAQAPGHLGDAPAARLALGAHPLAERGLRARVSARQGTCSFLRA